MRGAHALVADVLEVVETLQAPEWEAPSGCPGWRVQDVITHLAAFFELIADPASATPLTPADSTEAVNEEAVAARRDHPGTQAHEDYRHWSQRALKALARLENPAAAQRLVCMGDIGSYPLSAMSEAVCFDHLCHLVHDVLAPGGPVPRPRPHLDEVRLAPALDWMLRGLPVMSDPGLAAELGQPVLLDLSGPGGRTVLLGRGDDGGVRVTPAPTDHTRDVARSDGIAFLAWATRRVPWRDVVELHGDEAHIGRVLDRIRVV